MRAILASLALAFSVTMLAVPVSAQDTPKDHKWDTYKHTGFGFRVTYPADLFSPQGLTDEANGQVFRTNDGSAQFSVTAYINTDDAEAIDYYKSKVLETDDYPQLTYQPTGGTWFVLSGYHQDSIYYEKYIMSCSWRVINALLVSYPRAKRAMYDKIVTRLEKTFKTGHGQNNPSESCG